MNESLISIRYATALFSLAKEKGILLEIKQDMELILNVCDQSADFSRMLSSPVIKPSGKIKVLKELFGRRVNQLSMNFLMLAVRKKRETYIQAVSRDVLDFIRKEKNINTAVVTTARILDNATVEKVQSIIEKELGTPVDLKTKTNPKLIGGLLLRIGDQQYDATISTQLKKLKQEFLESRL